MASGSFIVTAPPATMQADKRAGRMASRGVPPILRLDHTCIYRFQTTLPSNEIAWRESSNSESTEAICPDMNISPTAKSLPSLFGCRSRLNNRVKTNNHLLLRRRTMKTIAKSLFLALPFILAPIAFAQHQNFTMNPDASNIAFSLGGNTHHVDGTFHVQRDRKSTRLNS